ncbi:uncharacterized protein LOC143604508 [Bidens hawaiensis]|uniref:uncharacterized protein LOC143604508 n=1 Tax=Bidens hawaiensis TaxID=980011 RepID=UPI00404A820C
MMMPERGAKTHLVNKGKSHQSAWLTHWAGTRCETSKTEHLSHLSRGEENDGIEKSSDNFGLHEKLTSDLNVSRECHAQPTYQVKYHMFFSESSYLPAENIRNPTTSFASKDHLPGEKSKMPSFCGQNNPARLKTSPSSSSHRSLYFFEEQYRRMQKHIGTGFFSNHADSRQNVVHDVEMTKMSGGLQCFSRTTHRLLLTKQTDVNVYQAVKELNGSPARSGEGPQGVKLQLLDSSQQESQENVEYYSGVKKNESSADTNAVCMESFKENQLSDVHLLPTNKGIIVDSNIESIGKSRKRKMDLSNINLDISALPDASSSAEKPEQCMSRTQSLDMNTLHYTLNQTTNSSFNECSNSNRGPQPGARWVKRLKLTEASSSRGKSEIQTGKSSSMDTKQECCWIQRWSPKHKQNQKTDETSNVTTDEYQKKQFPSVAAMALMGKAMTGLPQCKMQKQESFAVWNTKLSISYAGDIANSFCSGFA